MLIESLEGRTLLSASAVNTQVKIDRLEVKADLLKFRSDIAANSATILADVQLLRNDGLKNNASLKALLKAFRKDANSMHQQLFSDRLNQKLNVLQDQLVIVHDQIELLNDKHHGSESEVDDDKGKLLADRVQLQTDEIAGLNARITTRQTFFTTLSNDINALVTAAESDPTTSPQLQTDIQKFATDRSFELTTLTTDLTAITAARTQLAADLMALEA